MLIYFNQHIKTLFLYLWGVRYTFSLCVNLSVIMTVSGLTLVNVFWPRPQTYDSAIGKIRKFRFNYENPSRDTPSGDCKTWSGVSDIGRHTKMCSAGGYFMERFENLWSRESNSFWNHKTTSYYSDNKIKTIVNKTSKQPKQYTILIFISYCILGRGQ